MEAQNLRILLRYSGEFFGALNYLQKESLLKIFSLDNLAFKIDKLAYTYGTDPVKLTAASSGCFDITLPNTGPSDGKKLTTPSGKPASRKIL